MSIRTFNNPTPTIIRACTLHTSHLAATHDTAMPTYPPRLPTGCDPWGSACCGWGRPAALGSLMQPSAASCSLVRPCATLCSQGPRSTAKGSLVQPKAALCSQGPPHAAPHSTPQLGTDRNRLAILVAPAHPLGSGRGHGLSCIQYSMHAAPTEKCYRTPWRGMSTPERACD